MYIHKHAYDIKIVELLGKRKGTRMSRVGEGKGSGGKSIQRFDIYDMK